MVKKKGILSVFLLKYSLSVSVRYYKGLSSVCIEFFKIDINDVGKRFVPAISKVRRSNTNTHSASLHISVISHSVIHTVTKLTKGESSMMHIIQEYWQKFTYEGNIGTKISKYYYYYYYYYYYWPPRWSSG